ncbi:MAG: T9SS type A sorting domain-containing protein, partial [Bacteroidales bacterium]|nr:T9SS type A sorting domain-containing protein [Bacteroidales bacterium]
AEVNTGLTDAYVTSLTVCDNNIFAGTYDHGVFTSSDNGSNWTPVNNGISNLKIRFLEVIRDCIYAGSHNGILYKSTNNGNNWTTVNTGMTGGNYYSMVSNESYIFMGATDGVLISANNGSSWEIINTGLLFQSVRALLLKGDYLFAGTYGGGVWKRSISDILSTEENTVNKDIIVFPNPAADKITVINNKNDRETILIQLYNLNGQEMRSEKFTGQNTISIDTRFYAKGFYLLTIQVGKKTMNQKLIIQ